MSLKGILGRFFSWLHTFNLSITLLFTLLKSEAPSFPLSRSILHMKKQREVTVLPQGHKASRLQNRFCLRAPNSHPPLSPLGHAAPLAELRMD